ncbi:Fc.00g059920.m01.CDS01 [Cosmosporella sp. VM-42]
MTTSDRQYDITVLGATGWTAAICAEHIAGNFPTKTKWCIAGRSAAKLEALRASLKATNPDRVEPAISIIPRLDKAGLDPIVRNTRVVINGIGPYHRFGTPAVESCVRNGTHYVDFSTETAWIVEMVKAYNDTAEKSGVMIIPAISGSSSPSDLVAWLIAGYLRDEQLPKAWEVLCSGKLNMLGMQGGSLHTVVDVAENYGIGGWLRGNSWAMSSVPRPPRGSEPGFLGHRHDPILGHLGTSFVAWGNQSVVQRSVGLDPETYGPGFIFREYVPVPTFASGALIHIVTKLGILLLAIPWFRSFVRGKSFEPGSGPDREESRKKESAEWKATAYLKGENKPVATAAFEYKGALVDMAAILAVEAAQSIIEIEEGNKNMKGGLLTPSTLGWTFVDRLRNVGFTLDVRGA